MARRGLLLFGWLAALAGCGADPMAGRECRTNQDCGFEQQCVGGRCLGRAAGCTSDLACGAGEACDLSSGLCVRFAPLACAEDEDCPPPQRCGRLSGICEDPAQEEPADPEDPPGPECASDLGCSAPERVCEAGRCVPGCGRLESPIRCGEDEICGSEGRCVPGAATCAVDRDCGPPDLVCDAGRCRPGCLTTGCPSDRSCDPGTGRCVAPACTDDADCGPPQSICEGGGCVPGCTASSCPSGQVCGAGGRCEPAPGPSPGPVPGPISNPPCTRTADCGSGTCFDFGDGIGSVCADSCAGGADCPRGSACVGFAGAKACLDARFFTGATFTADAGAACTGPGDCRSGYCPGARQCVELCDRDGDCPGGTCRWSEVDRNQFAAVCGGVGGSLPGGSRCSFDVQCRSGVCYAPGFCGELCGSSADCGPAEVCTPVDYSACVAGFVSCQRWQVNLVTACVQATPGSLGPGRIGSPCTGSIQCRDGICDTRYGVCTGACSRDGDCPAPMRCGLAPYGNLGAQTLYFNACLLP